MEAKGRLTDSWSRDVKTKLYALFYAIERYIDWCESRGVNLRNGYLFRIVDESGRVLDQNVSYETIYCRLREYLTTLGIYEGETPHSMRAGCSILLGMSGSVQTESQMMDHIGWHTEESALYYSRIEKFKDAAIVAGKLAHSVDKSDEIEGKFLKQDETSLKKAIV